MIVELLKKIAAEYTRQGYGKDKRKTVGVISFYQKQVDIIRRLFKAVRRDSIFDAISVDINTVDRFQGKEKNIIITSLVRNNKRGRASKHIVAFERINVAFSRAQELLLIVGAKHLYDNMEVELPGLFDKHVTTVPVYKNIIADMHTKGCYIDSAKVASNELQNIVKAEVKKVKEENAGKED